MTRPSRTKTGSKPMRTPQSGITKIAVTCRICVQISLRTRRCSRRHPTSPASLCGALRGLPFFVVAPRPGCQPRRSARRRRRPWRLAPSAAFVGRGPAADCRPTATPAGRVPRRPSSHAAAGRPRPAQSRAVAQVAVVGDDQEGGRAVGAVDHADVVDHGQDHAVGGPRAAVADDQAGRDPLVRAGPARPARRRRARW